MQRIIITADNRVLTHKWTGVGDQKPEREISLTAAALARLRAKLANAEKYGPDASGRTVYIYRHPVNLVTVNEAHYKRRTDPRLVAILERFRGKGIRLALWYGDVKTGRIYADRPDVGYISGASFPLLVHNRRSFGGMAILDDCIVKIEYANKRDGGTLYAVTPSA